jgi:hypothetical protein
VAKTLLRAIIQENIKSTGSSKDIYASMRNPQKIQIAKNN